MIIGINGYAGTGKDTIGAIIQYLNCRNIDKFTFEEIITDYKNEQWWIEEESGWEIKKWAGKLKFIASILTGIDEEKFEDQEFKKTDLGKEWSYHYPGEYYDDGAPVIVAMSVRQFLQKLGTEGLRTGLHENTWVNALMADYTPIYNPKPDDREDELKYPNWIITDTRFPNEAQAIKDAGGIVIRVDRLGVSAINAHSSETALDNWDFDHKIMNGSDLVSLVFSVSNILKKEGYDTRTTTC